MAAIPFAKFRFTLADMEIWENRVAKRRCDKGLWCGWTRHSHSEYDEIAVMLPNIPKPAFRFHRLRDGRYRLWICDGLGCQVVKEDDTAEGCLFMWLRPKEFLDSIAPGADRSFR